MSAGDHSNLKVPVAKALTQATTAVVGDSVQSSQTAAYLGTSSDGGTPPPSIPGYEILAQIGRGGMGVVCKARHAGLNRIVAIKMISAGQSARDEIERFRAEAQALAQLQHPNIVQIFEVGEYDGRVFFTMECCLEGTLAQKLAGTPLPPGEAARLLETLARAVHAAHQRQIVHRDLKPGNILLAEGGVPKIADFGLAKRLDGDSQQTQAGVVMGTPSYMAPEQAEGKTTEVGKLADIYALGAILYETLTGRPPFKAATSRETILQVIHRDPVSPTTIQPALPRDLETICLKCLEKQPHKRYASAEELADDLQRFSEGKPILARPAGRMERLVKWTRRHPALASFWCLLVLTCAVLGFGLYQTNRALDAESLRLSEAEKLTFQTNRALEAESSRLSEAKKLSDEQHARQIDQTRADAESAAQRGDWKQMLEHLDRASRQGVTLTAAERFKRVRALVTLNRPEKAKAELAELAAAPESAEYAGLLHLYRGDMLWSADDNKAVELLQLALKQGKLPLAEEAYARGAISESMVESIRQYREALKHDPFHSNARNSLAFALIFSGELDEASVQLRAAELFLPNDGQLHLGLAMIAYLRGDDRTGARHIDRLAESLEPETVEFLRFACKLFPGLQRNLRAGLGLEEGDIFSEAAVLMQLKQFNQLKKNQGPAMWKHLRGDDAVERMPPISFKPAVRTYFNHMMRLLGPHIPIGENDENVQIDPKHMRAVTEYVAEHPEGFLRLLVATIQNIESTGKLFPKDEKGDRAFGERMAKLSAAYKLAYESKSIVDIRREALDGWIVYEGMLGATNRVNPDLKAQRHAAELIWEFRRYQKIPPPRFDLYCKIARNAKDWPLARLISDEWLAKSPDNVDALRLRARFEKLADDPAQALVFAQRLLRKLPNDADMKSIEKWGSERLKMLIK